MTLTEQLAKTIKRNHPIREQVSQCSTGVYYPQYNDYFSKVVDVLDHYGLDMTIPVIYNENGRGFANVENNGVVISIIPQICNAHNPSNSYFIYSAWGIATGLKLW